MDIQSLCEKLLPVFESYGVTCCYLFGSRAGENYYQDSDLDLAVVFDSYSPEKHNLDLEMELQYTLSKILAPLEVDLLFLQKAPIYLKFTVIKNGKIIYSSNEDFRTDFEEMTIRDYLDFKPVLEMYYREMAEELTAKNAKNGR